MTGFAAMLIISAYYKCISAIEIPIIRGFEHAEMPNVQSDLEESVESTKLCKLPDALLHLIDLQQGEKGMYNCTIAFQSLDLPLSITKMKQDFRK